MATQDQPSTWEYTEHELYPRHYHHSFFFCRLQ